MPKNKTVTKSMDELVSNNDSPIPLGLFPNQMGINLCSVGAITWTRQEDGQLVSVVIHFNPVDAKDVT